MRVKAVIAYDGSEFDGFQRQKHTENTVTGAIERAFAGIGIKSAITASGRTDKGVHATGQVIHFDIPMYWQSRTRNELMRHINTKLSGIRFKHISPVDKYFHARYDAKERIYRYVFRTNPSLFERKYVSLLEIDDMELFKDALNIYKGEHNFSAFKKSGSYTKSDVRRVKRAYFMQRGGYNYIYLHADGFLRSQVRLMISGAAAVANRDISLDELKEQLYDGKEYIRKPAPPEGLYLARVIY